MISFAQIFPKQALKGTIFYNLQKRPKNGQMAKPFYFWQTVSKRPNGNPDGNMTSRFLLRLFVTRKPFAKNIIESYFLKTFLILKKKFKLSFL